MVRRIEDYALIGDGETAALAGIDGAIDWLCWPRFDSDACFAALLGGPEHGHWTISAAAPPASRHRCYLPDTLVVQSETVTADGVYRLTDFMPIRLGASRIIRIVEGLSGRPKLAMTLALRFGYGRLPPWTEPCEGGLVARIGPDLVRLRAPVPITQDRRDALAEFSVAPGERLDFELAYGSSIASPPEPVDALAALQATTRHWTGWAARARIAGALPHELVRRSLITLKALVHGPTGGIIAAPTTSLPEAPGGSMNWDYRYCWLRDATFTLTALLNAGYTEEALAWRDWLLRAVAGSPEHMQIMYRVDGARHLQEWAVDWLPGFNWARPVRIGNAAAAQHQADVTGELIDCLDLGTKAGLPRSTHLGEVEAALVEHIENRWRAPGQGIWEDRGPARHHTHGKVMAWVGVDRCLRGSRRRGGDGPAILHRLAALRRHIHDEVCREAYHDGLGRFVAYYGGQALDASLLLMPIVGFLPARDPRVARTIAAVARELVEDGLVFRHASQGDATREGAFLACSFWLADCYALLGEAGKARAQFERAASVANDVGLLAEEYDTRGKALVGNFPQALSHLALVNTALRLAGPMIERAS